MAVKQSDYMTGVKNAPSPDEPAELYAVTVKLDTAVTNLAAGDFLQLLQLPANAQLDDIQIGVSASFGTTTIAAGLADALVTTALATTFIAAGTLTTTAVVHANATVMGDVAIPAPTVDQRIVTLAIGVAAIATGILYATVYYKAKA